MARGFRYGGGAGQIRFREKYRQPDATGKTAVQALSTVLDAMDAEYKQRADEKAKKAIEEQTP